jgi:hypothetical protein
MGRMLNSFEAKVFFSPQFNPNDNPHWDLTERNNIEGEWDEKHWIE